MKDPCLECLVRVTCWQECDDKKNYATLISQALQNYRGVGLLNPVYRKQHRDLMKKSTDHVMRRSKISRRASLMSKDK